MPKDKIDKHDEDLICTHNSFVKPGDTVYHVGDFCFGSKERAREILRRLNGQVHIIFGNHDKPARSIAEDFVSASEMKKIKISVGRAKKDVQYIILCHYAIAVWDLKHHGSWCIAAHSHGNFPPTNHDSCELGLQFDVGVDSVAKMLGGSKPLSEHYRPVSFEELRSIMKNKEKMISLGNVNVHRDHHKPSRSS
jgi:calcineurin-like phosphoesterase family protein